MPPMPFPPPGGAYHAVHEPPPAAQRREALDAERRALAAVGPRASARARPREPPGLPHGQEHDAPPRRLATQTTKGRPEAALRTPRRATTALVHAEVAHRVAHQL